MNLKYCLIVWLLSLQILNAAYCQTDANLQYKGITIYIDYPDEPAWVAPDRLDSLINGMDYQETGAERSFRKYWYQQSKRNIDIQHDIFYYTAPMPSSHYESVNWQEGILLWKNALEWIIQTYPEYDWRSLSIVDDDFQNLRKGGLLSVMIISSKWGPAGVGAAHGPGWVLSNGVKINKIAGSVIKSPWDTTPVNLFMILHESGHGIFSLPDTYDTDSGAEHSGGTGFYSLMSGGKPDVEPLGGPFQVQNGWAHIIEPGPGPSNYILRADGDSLVIFRNKRDPNEYFTIEARKKSNQGNSLFPVPIGLLVWHSDLKVHSSNRFSDMTPLRHYKHSIEQADGLFQLEKSATNRGDRGDIYIPWKDFGESTTPNSNWWDGLASGFELSNIKYIDDERISFDINITDSIELLPFISQAGWTAVESTPSVGGYTASKAIDGDSLTYYHVPYGNNYPRPHFLVIDMGQTYILNELYYTANLNTSPPWEGRIADYKIYLSIDRQNWGDPVVSGTFFNTYLPQYAVFPNTPGRFLKLEAVDSWLGDLSRNDTRTSVAELKVRGSSDAPISEFTAGHREISPGSQVIFKDLSGNAPTSWSWTFEGGYPSSSTEQNPLVSYPDTGSFAVTLSATNLFGTDTKTVKDFVHVVSSTGVPAVRELSIDVYPNPFNEELKVDIPSGQTAEVSLLNISGIELESRIISQPVSLDMGYLKEGLYYLKIRIADRVIVKKVLKTSR